MRIMLNVTIPNEEFNAAARDGSAGAKMGKILEEFKPEAVYFSEEGGNRSCVMVVHMSDPSEIPSYGEPWFLLFNAKVEFKVAMTPEDLMKSNLEELGKKWS